MMFSKLDASHQTVQQQEWNQKKTRIKTKQGKDRAEQQQFYSIDHLPIVKLSLFSRSVSLSKPSIITER
jgi:hypothetical protein